jgi:hypothetical protein
VHRPFGQQGEDRGTDIAAASTAAAAGPAVAAGPEAEARAAGSEPACAVSESEAPVVADVVFEEPAQITSGLPTGLMQGAAGPGIEGCEPEAEPLSVRPVVRAIEWLIHLCLVSGRRMPDAPSIL